MIVPSAMRKVILRNGSPGCSQPIATKYGVSATLMRPPQMAGMPMRAPTTMPAPNVEAENSIALRSAIFGPARPVAMPMPMPVPSLFTERRKSTGSVSARRMLATASPDGNVSCIRSTRIGV